MKKAVLLIALLGVFYNANGQNRILIITSNQHYYGDTKIPAANHFEEIVVAYDVFVQNGFQVDILSPEGGAIPIGYLNTSHPLQKKYIYDAYFMDKLKHTLKPSEVNAAFYDAVYYSGGGAAMFGVANNSAMQDIAVGIYQNDGVVSAVCHGTAGLVYLRDAQGKSILQGKKITGFPDAFERKEGDYYATFPFKMDEAIQRNGGNFVYSEKGWDKYYVRDGRIITGQDPTSVPLVAQELISLLKEKGTLAPNMVQVSEQDKIQRALLDYIEGTANGQPERVRNAFHEELNLYSIKGDSLSIWYGQDYVNGIKPGKKNNRQGKILFIDYENNAATAKVEITIPNWRVFTDYFLLLKIKGTWKIVHKSYTWRNLVVKTK